MLLWVFSDSLGVIADLIPCMHVYTLGLSAAEAVRSPASFLVRLITLTRSSMHTILYFAAHTWSLKLALPSAMLRATTTSLYLFPPLESQKEVPARPQDGPTVEAAGTAVIVNYNSAGATGVHARPYRRGRGGVRARLHRGALTSPWYGVLLPAALAAHMTSSRLHITGVTECMWPVVYSPVTPSIIAPFLAFTTFPKLMPWWVTLTWLRTKGRCTRWAISVSMASSLGGRRGIHARLGHAGRADVRAAVLHDFVPIVPCSFLDLGVHARVTQSGLPDVRAESSLGAWRPPKFVGGITLCMPGISTQEPKEFNSGSRTFSRGVELPGGDSSAAFPDTEFPAPLISISEVVSVGMS